jgi:two-component sensor histidine kinase/ligand-binding sensor protein
MAKASPISADLLAELLDPSSWSSPLNRFARTTNVAVALTDVTGRLMGECQNPQPVWLLSRDSAFLSGAVCPFCVLKQTQCAIVPEALRTGEVTEIRDAAGLAHIAAPLFLDGASLGAVIAGQVFVDYPQPLALQRLANELHLAVDQVWQAATTRPPIRPATLHAYGELLESLGRALVHERYSSVLAERLRRALEEKTILLQEVHHRVKNNMAVVSSLLGLHADSIANEEAADNLRDSQMRVLSMASIHEYLYGSESLKQIRFDKYVGELAARIAALFGSENVRIEMKVDPIELTIDESIPCGLIFNELLMNAFKYAFPNGRPGVITIVLAIDKPGVFRISVADNGIGAPQSIDLQEPRSLGLRIVRTLTRQLSGKLELYRDNGTKFEVLFPSAQARVANIESTQAVSG